MKIRKFHVPLKMAVKRLAVLLVTVVILFGFSQVAVANPTPRPLVALAASSRFAAQAESKDAKPVIPEEKLSEMREQRREWQNKAATQAAAAAEADKQTKNSAGESIKDRLNLDEITQENEIVETITNSQRK